MLFAFVTESRFCRTMLGLKWGRFLLLSPRNGLPKSMEVEFGKLYCDIYLLVNGQEGETRGSVFRPPVASLQATWGSENGSRDMEGERERNGGPK